MVLVRIFFVFSEARSVWSDLTGSCLTIAAWDWAGMWQLRHYEADKLSFSSQDVKPQRPTMEGINSALTGTQQNIAQVREGRRSEWSVLCIGTDGGGSQEGTWEEWGRHQDGYGQGAGGSGGKEKVSKYSNINHIHIYHSVKINMIKLQSKVCFWI